ncbi:MAG TPA: 2-oxoglutarate dehydrogenase complex dihydrolipoyllysine-residue succinyltransferase [Bacteroides sp.]|nr:2-oxoglutarate dehydrogenase complex dihydrolipoyllysine-residue succinyltransferase [Bacteroides sp.]
MALEIKVPSPGESITEVELASWLVEDGALVTRDQEVGEIESEKATLPLIAAEPGKIKLLVKEGTTVKVGDVVASIDTSVEVKPDDTADSAKEPAGKAGKQSGPAGDVSKVKITPVAREIMEKEGVSIEEILTGLRKLNANDVKKVLALRGHVEDPERHREKSREEERQKISQLRKKISERLVAVKNETAMLTTFNEADMSAVISLRKKYQEAFMEKYGVKLGFMSFFTRAVTEALRQYPSVNSYLDGEELVIPRYCDIGIAVQSEKGLMVPVIRNAESMGFAELEKHIADLADRARRSRLGIGEMSGGTFTISNGGIYGSMLSTPILNPPQSGILGMHNIKDRPVAIGEKVEIRPMMYLALSYDHRLIDGRDSVGFLKTVKEFIEEPVRMNFGTTSPEQYLLGL